MTFGVLTKIDLMDKGTDAVKILEGRAYRLNFPWIGIVNRSQADINQIVDMITARRKEREYFANTLEYSDLANRMGSEHLGKVLSEVFIVIHVVALAYYIKRILSPKMFKVAATLVVSVGLIIYIFQAPAWLLTWLKLLTSLRHECGGGKVKRRTLGTSSLLDPHFVVTGAVHSGKKLKFGSGGDLLARNGRWNFINKCYDKYLAKFLQKAADARGHSFWGRPPDHAGSYNSQPQDTEFFCDGGDYDSAYGRFFLNWYSQYLIEHGDRVLAMANLAFEGTPISVKVSGIHWWYKTTSHAAELTAGFYNRANMDGYSPIALMLKKHGTALNFTCVELCTVDQQDFPEAMGDPKGLVWQVQKPSF